MADQTLPLDVSYEMNNNETGQEKKDMSVEENLYSSSLDTPEELCSSSVTDTCRDCVLSTLGQYVRILDLREGNEERHMMFSQSDRKTYKKAISDGANVSVVLDVGCGNT